jgi:hypothetical protein
MTIGWRLVHIVRRPKIPDIQLPPYSRFPNWLAVPRHALLYRVSKNCFGAANGRKKRQGQKQYRPNHYLFVRPRSPVLKNNLETKNNRASALRREAAEGGADRKQPSGSDSTTKAGKSCPVSAFRFAHHTPNSVEKKAPNNLETHKNNVSIA